MKCIEKINQHEVDYLQHPKASIKCNINEMLIVLTIELGLIAQLEIQGNESNQDVFEASFNNHGSTAGGYHQHSVTDDLIIDIDPNHRVGS